MPPYKDDIRQTSQKHTLNLFELIEVLVQLYGEMNENNEKIILTDKIEEILDTILTPDCRLVACFVMNTPEARGKLNWHHDICEGEGYLTEK